MLSSINYEDKMTYRTASQRRSRCVMCGRKFAHVRTGALYCSELCKQRAKRERKRELEREKNVERADHLEPKFDRFAHLPKYPEEGWNDPF